MGKFILTEEEKSYIQSLYNLSEQTQNHTVKEIQELLHKYGYGEECGPADGKYGLKTANALSLYLKDKKAGTLRVQSSGTASDSTDTSTPEATTPSEEELEVSKIEKQLNGVSAEEVKKGNENSEKVVQANKNMKKNSRPECRGIAANARYFNRKGISIGDSGMNKEVLSYCLNTYMKRGEKKIRQWAGL
jgi:hypothetical protein